MVKTYDGRILDGWAKGMTPEGLPFYANHSHKITQWDHPEYVRIIDDLCQFNDISYAAYRTALKIRSLQTRFKTNNVTIHCVSSAFGNCNLRTAENGDYVSVVQIEKVIHSILKSTHRHTAIDISFCTDIIVNFLLNAFDRERSGYLKVLSCKVLLSALCGSKLQEKYRYLFSQIADHNNCCTRKKLAIMLRDLSKIPELLSEHPSFGITYIPAAVDSCFSDVEGDVGITEDIFLKWLHQQPQTLVWLPTLYRLSMAEFVCHDVKCNICKQKPLLGMRYQCLRCINYNLCQECFLHARTSRGHKISHPIQEYCHESTARQCRKAFVKSVVHRLRGSQDYRPKYLSLPSTTPTHTLGSLLINESGTEASVPEDSAETETSRGSKDSDYCPVYSLLEDFESTKAENPESLRIKKPATLNLATPAIKNSSDHSFEPSSQRRQIQSVILHLEEGQRQLAEKFDDKSMVSSHCIEEHNSDLQLQINKLKLILQNYCKSSKKPNRLKQLQQEFASNAPVMESTPVANDKGLWPNLSPIVTEMNNLVHSESALLDNKENHFMENQKSSSIVQSKEVSLGSLDMSAIDTVPSLVTQDFSFSSEAGLTDLSSVAYLSKESESTCSAKAFDDQSNLERIDNLGAGEAEVAEMQEDLEQILIQLSQLFNFKTSDTNYQNEVLTAANEIGDILGGYTVDLYPKDPSNSQGSQSFDLSCNLEESSGA